MFEGCDTARYKGNDIKKSAFSFGTKLMHFYNPEGQEKYIKTELNVKKSSLYSKKPYKGKDHFNLKIGPEKCSF